MDGSAVLSCLSTTNTVTVLLCSCASAAAVAMACLLPSLRYGLSSMMVSRSLSNAMRSVLLSCARASTRLRGGHTTPVCVCV
jgi:hypothetical protein